MLSCLAPTWHSLPPFSPPPQTQKCSSLASVCESRTSFELSSTIIFGWKCRCKRKRTIRLIFSHSCERVQRADSRGKLSCIKMSLLFAIFCFNSIINSPDQSFLPNVTLKASLLASMPSCIEQLSLEACTAALSSDFKNMISSETTWSSLSVRMWRWWSNLQLASLSPWQEPEVT